MPNGMINTLELVGPKAKIDEFYNTLQAQLVRQDPQWGLSIEGYDGFFELPQEFETEQKHRRLMERSR